MALGWILGCVNFGTDVRENRQVRCGWMYYTGKCQVYGLKRLKIPPIYHVKKSAISYDGRILEGSGLLGRDLTNDH